ncbi:MAG: prepilin-type N-terminal cleavage/methylation domain-containing protein [Candidatus Eisenbacteria bacterium]
MRSARAVRRPGCDGVTLAELLVVMVVIALLAGGAIALLSKGHAEAVALEAAQRVAADLIFAQTDARANRSERAVAFSVEADGYRIYAAGDGTTLTHPVSKRPFEVTLGELFPGAGLHLQSADFDGGTTLEFDRAGLPRAGGTIIVSASGRRFFVDVAAGTRRVSVRAPATKPDEPQDPDPDP